jgi:hypothetical protein
MSTGVPRGRILESVVIAVLSMRMQPCETLRPRAEMLLLPRHAEVHRLIRSLPPTTNVADRSESTPIP